MVIDGIWWGFNHQHGIEWTSNPSNPWKLDVKRVFQPVVQRYGWLNNQDSGAEYCEENKDEVFSEAWKDAAKSVSPLGPVPSSMERRMEIFPWKSPQQNTGWWWMVGTSILYFPIHIGLRWSSQLTHIFQRGWNQPPTSKYMVNLWCMIVNAWLILKVSNSLYMGLKPPTSNLIF